MFIADLLSRPPTERDVVKVQRVEMHAERYVNAIKDVDLELIKRYGLEDKDYADILRGIDGDWPRVMTAKVRRVRSNADSFSIVDGMIMMN